MGWQTGRVGEEDQCQSLGDLFRERVIEHERVITTFAEGYIISPLCDLVCLTFSGPSDCFQADSCQFFDDGRLLLSCGCGEVLGGIGTLRVGGREMGA